MIGRSMSTSAPRAEIVNAFMRGVYGWMFLGLGVTAVTAFAVISSQAVLEVLFSNSFNFILLVIAEFGLVMYLSARINRLSATAATGMFLAYSALNGVTLSVILLAYTMGTVFSAFITTAGMFGVMSLYGLVTKKDLTGWASFLMMGLVGVLIAMVVHMFIGGPALNMLISVVGVIVFLGLTAYDSQKLRYMGETMPVGDETAIRRGSILGALTLYLDFINLFLFMLRFMGSGRD